MRDFRGGPQVTSRDDQRVTRVGKILRKTKLDELPELWNVLKGDMSLVGPRPEVPEYVDLANPQWALVLSVRPGITDPVTMRLRNEEGLLEIVSGDRERFYREVLQPIKLRGSLDYLLKRTWGQDTIILLRTVVSVILPNRVPAPKPKELEIQ
jgi:lipopolysaccharide/colanic/teichoic acid biosynthesis glycosyltransferase